MTETIMRTLPECEHKRTRYVPEDFLYYCARTGCDCDPNRCTSESADTVTTHD